MAFAGAHKVSAAAFAILFYFTLSVAAELLSICGIHCLQSLSPVQSGFFPRRRSRRRHNKRLITLQLSHITLRRRQSTRTINPTRHRGSFIWLSSCPVVHLTLSLQPIWQQQPRHQQVNQMGNPTTNVSLFLFWASHPEDLNCQIKLFPLQCICAAYMEWDGCAIVSDND